jgi:hypothetical protein
MARAARTTTKTSSNTVLPAYLQTVRGLSSDRHDSKDVAAQHAQDGVQTDLPPLRVARECQFP